MSVVKVEEETSPWQVTMTVLLLILFPQAVAIALFSSMGLAVEVAALAAKDDMDMAGNGMAALFAMLLAFAFVIDVTKRNVVVQVIVGFLGASSCLAAASLKSISYPWLSGLVCFCLAIIMVAWLRSHFFKADEVKGQIFFQAMAMGFFLAALALVAAWTTWQSVDEKFWGSATKDWLAAQNSALYASLNVTYTQCVAASKSNSTDYAAVSSACQTAETVWFLQWSGPCALGICNVIVAGFGTVFAQAADTLGDDSGTDAQGLKKVLKTSFAMIVFMLGVMYSAQYVSGANVTVSSGLLALAAASAAAIFGFLLLEVGPQRLHLASQSDPLAALLIGVLKSDWVKAVSVASLNVFIPVMALLDMLRERVRRCAKHPPASGQRYTTEGQRVAEMMGSWDWCSIFFKVNRIGQLGAAMLLGMKLTYVFFSWLNETLAAAGLAYAVLCLMILAVGLGMFLCPIVPGSAVYIFAGVVLGAQSQASSGPGFELGVASAVVVSSVAKIVACLLQYSMGFAMGKSVKVQQFVGVDKVAIRAMEKILKQNGIKIDKAAILVAGPDWPTSVLCGILRLRIPSMLLGTLPVILVSIGPQVLVGALLTYQAGSSGIMSMISSSVTLFAAVVQAVAMLFFTYRIMRVVDECGEELKEWRPEHAAVAALTEKEKAFVDALHEASDWRQLKMFKKMLVTVSSLSIMLASFILMADYSVAAADKFALRSFAITNSIGASFEENGLEGDALNIVMSPVGWMALGLILFGTLLDVLVNKLLACDGRKLLMRETE
ncbi:unnamed protein product [Effrenium voratum]|uniref:Uncharacterized protein n=1 Tax=Effrenium voratum TaxID=2562239 RepID=A0AA36JKA9_9DINO|nr:unnamed protein product [Effrenium voratum]CAJ1431932.1 unnamed protein product [Effrenium voratum]